MKFVPMESLFWNEFVDFPFNYLFVCNVEDGIDFSLESRVQKFEIAYE